MSTMLPGLTRWAGFSTRRWKIHGWLERQALRRRMVGRGGGAGGRPGAPPPLRAGGGGGAAGGPPTGRPPPPRRRGGGGGAGRVRRRGAPPPPLAGEGWGGGKPPDPCIPAIRRHPWRMHLRSADEPRDPVAQRAADKRRLANAVRGSLAFVLLLVLVFGLQGLGDARALAVGPGSAAGLLGLLTAPLLHGSPAHLLANASALLILGTLALAVYPRATVRALPLMWLGSGLGAWLLGEPGSWH